MLPLIKNETKLLTDLNNTINKFHQMIYNPLLNENVFEIENLETIENDISESTFNIDYISDDKRKLMDEHFNYLIQNCEDKVKLLSLENEKLKNKLQDCENIQKNNEEEKTNYIKELIDNKNLFDELQNKINFLENENITLKNQDTKNYKLLNENINEMKNELNYKNSIIRYLEELLKRTETNPKLYTEETYKEEFQKENTIQNKYNDMNYYLERRNSNESENNKNKYNTNYQKVSSIEKENLMNLNNKKEKHKNNKMMLRKEDFKDKKPKKIKKEIDSLDKEIFELQSKLKKMLNK